MRNLGFKSPSKLLTALLCGRGLPDRRGLGEAARLGPDLAESWLGGEEGDEKQFLCQAMASPGRPAVQRAAAAPFLLKLVAQTARGGLVLPAPAGPRHLRAVSVREEPSWFRLLWETFKSSKWQTVSLPS